ncbi:MAG: SCP2 sterol-binding domain-containing protein [Ilumatobacteraceae bacterium]|nr:SCP2 sterol-binding domain-containing protein [Ilumatobacteraceae bacterium]MDP4703067.1 SCP2 sterol-binding domain-containing protein [Ilumatobacteraceae bacterium]
MTYQFLSTEWVAAARDIRDKYKAQTPPITVVVKINMVITQAPFDETIVKGFIDTSSGDMALELGELSDPEATVTTDYETASKLFVDQDPSAVMQAFMSGKIKIDGDMMKVMGMQTAIPQTGDAATVALAIAEEIKAVTA